MKAYRLLIVFLCILFITACKPPAEPVNPPDEVDLPANGPADDSAEKPADEPVEDAQNPWPDDAIVVTSTDDSGPGTLRQAIENAQENDNIVFDPAIFPPDAPATIFVTEELSHIRTKGLTIDASNAGVILDGSQVSGDWTACFQLVDAEGIRIMGLQISQFPGPGIAISGNSINNVIGGDQNIGSGPSGQGNVITSNQLGISIATQNTTDNTITGNLIGTNMDGADWLGNLGDGISIVEGAHHNTIGPDNIIAYNGRLGIYPALSDFHNNSATENSIFNNGNYKGEPPNPVITRHDLIAGTASGAACTNCTVEIYSTSNWQGEILEGETVANDLGLFSIDIGNSFTGPFLTARVIDQHNRPSNFSIPTLNAESNLVTQLGNDLPLIQYTTLFSSELAKNRIGSQVMELGFPEDLELTDLQFYGMGYKQARTAITGIEPVVDWDIPEFYVSPIHDDIFTRLEDNGITITFVLMFWDKDYYPSNDDVPCARFKTQGEIDRYLEFIRFTVGYFKDRVEYYEFWNEPDIEGFCPKWIESEDYINMVKQAVPVIREVDPKAKIVVGSVSKTSEPGAYNYLYDLLESEIMPLVDVIAWHPFYGESPEDTPKVAYYYGYPGMVEDIKATASANGFVGEYAANEQSWNLEVGGGSQVAYSLRKANKYVSRSIVMHLGLDIAVGLTGPYYVQRNFSTAMAGVKPSDLAIEIQSTAERIESYSFSLPEGGYQVGIWSNGIAKDFDPGIGSTIIIPDLSVSKVTAIDPFEGIEQELIFEIVDGDLVIENLLIKDYPILIRLEN